ncbi:sugar ABC transporter permease [Paenibacillus antri]|uniref:Sugar ABC transporter permease n=1 Tax=Paenibacillus antri TaxID=2582848 RepID=A0A5R9GF63_9BACL|nr:ABC transporter permease subunit [Paenibacillus antri]TLS51874.1 sugar ABC transporter permease [Paenibacillus antri]
MAQTAANRAEEALERNGGGFVRKEWRQFKKHYELTLIVLPAAIKIFIFSYLPMYGVVVAFKNYRYDLGIFGSEWVGLKNFEFFFVSEYAWRITRNTVLYELGYLALTTVCALALAVMMNEIGRTILKVYQTALFLPYFLSWAVVFYIVFAFLDINNGVLNRLIEQFGGTARHWYMEAEPWPYILNIVALWKRIGFSALVYYAGIMAINQEYYEAAKIDGATRLQMATRITIPMIMPLVAILIILAIGSLFSGDFGLHFFIPNNSGMTYPTTDIIDTYVYRALMGIGDPGMAAAVGLVQSLVGLALVVSANAVVRKINPDNSLW